MAIGRGNAAIALVLATSVNTVATHVRNILARAGYANRTEAAAFAVCVTGCRPRMEQVITSDEGPSPIAVNLVSTPPPTLVRSAARAIKGRGSL
jgi:hypothetical protein